MKKIVLGVALIFLVMTGRTQSFEGSIKWNLKMDITDPAAKAKMEEAKKKANDPATKAKMKEMEAKMNDPQFKAMLDANPQMKAQMEAMMKVMSGGDPSAMMPSAILLKMKGSNSLVSIQGGIMDKTDILHLSDKSETFTINHSAKTFTLMPKKESTTPTKPKVTKTSETTKILGYTCTKYLVETTDPQGRTMTTNYWATTEVKGIDLKALANQQVSKGDAFIYPDIEGFPMRVETQIPQTGTITIETAEINKGSVTSTDMQIPAGYTEAKL